MKKTKTLPIADAAPLGIGFEDRLAAVKMEARFYRNQLELIRQDSRRTRARRLAESALIFWDAMADKPVIHKDRNL